MAELMNKGTALIEAADFSSCKGTYQGKWEVVLFILKCLDIGQKWERSKYMILLVQYNTKEFQVIAMFLCAHAVMFFVNVKETNGTAVQKLCRVKWKTIGGFMISLDRKP